MRAAEYTATVLSESRFQEKVITRARAKGWMVHHARPAYNRDGDQVTTPIQGDPGFPDLVLTRDGQLVIVELKSERGVLSASQRQWLMHLCGDGSGHSPTRVVQEQVRIGDLEGIDTALLVTVWRPSDWPEICEVLE